MILALCPESSPPPAFPWPCSESVAPLRQSPGVRTVSFALDTYEFDQTS